MDGWMLEFALAKFRKKKNRWRTMKNLITGVFSLLKASLCINCKLYHNSSKTLIILCCGCTFLLYFLEVYRLGCTHSWCIVILKTHGWVHMVHVVKRNRLIHVCRSSCLTAWWQYFITETLVDLCTNVNPALVELELFINVVETSSALAKQAWKGKPIQMLPNPQFL